MSDHTLNWTTVGTDRRLDCRVFHVDEVRRRNHRRENSFFVLRGRDWVNIIPVTPRGEVVMIEQYRHGIDAVTLEVPGGVIDESDPTPLHAAVREMREETGYDSVDVRLLGRIDPNPALQSNHCSSFLALNAEARFTPSPDDDEEIRTVLVPLDDVPRLICEGRVNHALVVVAFSFLGLRRPDLFPRSTCTTTSWNA
jgi:8-oxo-dGTP pyrophosphatase MutT (NUDIX family)